MICEHVRGVTQPGLTLSSFMLSKAGRNLNSKNPLLEASPSPSLPPPSSVPPKVLALLSCPLNEERQDGLVSTFACKSSDPQSLRKTQDPVSPQELPPAMWNGSYLGCFKPRVESSVFKLLFLFLGLLIVWRTCPTFSDDRYPGTLCNFTQACGWGGVIILQCGRYFGLKSWSEEAEDFHYVKHSHSAPVWNSGKGSS